MNDLQQRVAEVLALEWRPVVGFEGFYEVSNAGEVRSVPRITNQGRALLPRILKVTNNGLGYMQITLRGKCARVHCIVAEAFHGPRKHGLVCRHINGDRTDNRADNLAWGTYAENERDKRDHGRAPIGSKNPRAKLNESKVADIRAANKIGSTNEDLARIYGVHRATIFEIVSGKKWRHVPIAKDSAR